MRRLSLYFLAVRTLWTPLTIVWARVATLRVIELLVVMLIFMNALLV